MNFKYYFPIIFKGLFFQTIISILLYAHKPLLANQVKF
jgi:hypothetical protein